MKEQQRSLNTQLHRYMLDARAQNFSPKTVGKMELGLRLFDDFVGGISDVRLVKGDDLRSFVLDLQRRTLWQGRRQASQRRLADSTIRTYAQAVKVFWSWLLKRRCMARNPLEDVPLPRIGKKLPRTFIEAEARSIMAAADSLRSQVLIWLLLDSGLRLCEVTGDDRHPSIYLENIDFETGTIMVCGKFGVERLVHVSPETIEVMRQYCLRERPQPVGPDKLLLNEDGTPMKGARVQKVLERIGRKAGLKQRLSPHKLRHTHSVLSIKYGSNIEYQRRELGHRHISTTQIYLSVCDDDLAKAHKSYSPVTNLLSHGKQGPRVKSLGQTKKEKTVMKFERPRHLQAIQGRSPGRVSVLPGSLGVPQGERCDHKGIPGKLTSAQTTRRG